MTDTSWPLEWRHGSCAFYARGGMLDGLQFRLPNGRVVEPLYRAPWLDEPDTPVQGNLANLRGEFACLPWGTGRAGSGPDGDLTADDLVSHGFPAGHDWHFVDRTELSLAIAIDFPSDNAISRLTRIVRADPQGSTITLETRVEARRSCQRSIAFHPSFALNGGPGSFELVPDDYAFGMVNIENPESGLGRALPSARFHDLSKVPLAEGGEGALNKVPFDSEREEIVMLCGMRGGISLKDRHVGAVYRLDWDVADLPNLAIWISNRGRHYSPWNGRNLCVGVEPTASGFGGIHGSLAENPINRSGIPTVLDFAAGEPRTFRYTISATEL